MVEYYPCISQYKAYIKRLAITHDLFNYPFSDDTNTYSFLVGSLLKFSKVGGRHGLIYEK
jgi:hypothetical protein